MSVSMLLSLFGSPIASWGIAAAVAVALFTWWTLRQRRKGREASEAEIARATLAESARRRDMIEQARRAADKEAERIRQGEDQDEARIAEIDEKSRAENGAGGLSAAAVRRLRDIGRR